MPRCTPGVDDQAWKLRRAAATARSTSSAAERATDDSARPVTGLILSNLAPLEAGAAAPSM